jgi:hypothetical protein
MNNQMSPLKQRITEEASSKERWGIVNGVG